MNPGINVNELLGILAVSKQALNAPLRKLIEQGLIKARMAPHDRRVKQLSLSGKGQNLEDQLTQTQMMQLEKVFTKAGPKAEQGWRKVMRKIPD